MRSWVCMGHATTAWTRRSAGAHPVYGDATRLNWNQLSELTRQIDGPLYIQSLTTSSLRQVMMNPLAVNSLTTQLKFSAIGLNSIKSSRSLNVPKYFGMLGWTATLSRASCFDYRESTERIDQSGCWDSNWSSSLKSITRLNRCERL